MNRTNLAILMILLVIPLLTLSGCGSSDGLNLPPCFPFVCQPTPAAPSVSTDAATNITAGSADLNGHVNPNWKDTGWRFEWGTFADMSNYSQSPGQFLGSGNSTSTISLTVGGLTGSTTYYYRTVAYNSLGTSIGNIVSFTTRT
jgi:predicted small lipoprotein YifL